MHQEEEPSYSTIIGARLSLIMQFAGLEVSGLAEFLQISESHLYSILNGRRKLTGKLAEHIGNKLGFDGWKILQLDYKIPLNIRKAPSLVEFYSVNKEIREYFIDTKDERKASYFIEFVLIRTDFFDQPKYVWEVRNICLESGRDYSSKNLSQLLLYLVEKGKLKKEKKFLKRKNGSFAEHRMVHVFFK